MVARSSVLNIPRLNRTSRFQISDARLALVVALSVVGATAWSQRGTFGYTPQVNLGERALARKQYSAAASYFRNALQYNASGVGAHIGLGNVYLRTSRSVKAREQFAIALKFSPHSAEAERGIHECRSDGEEQEAFQELELLVPKEPKNADIHTTYAEELLERDRTPEAKAQAELAIRLDSSQWHAWGVLGQVALKAGDLDAAFRFLETAIRHDNTDDDSLDALGKLYVIRKDYGGAVRAYRQWVLVAPEESEPHLKLREALESSGDHASAKTELALANAISAESKARGGSQ